MRRSFLTSSLVLVACALLGMGCDQGDERLRQKARIEGRAQAQTELQTQIESMDLLVQKARAEGRAQAEAEIAAQNGNLASKSSEMEADLVTRHLFYQAVRGIYEGSLVTEAGEYKVRITLVPSLPPYTIGRIRQLEEVTADLNNLYFHAQVVQWNPANLLSAVGCSAENIRPDVRKGEISIASSSCPNLYLLRISDPNSSDLSPTAVAVQMASLITEGKVAAVTQIVGEVYPGTNASVYSLTVNRLQTK